MAFLDEDNPSNVGKRVGVFVVVGAALLAGKFLVPLSTMGSSSAWTPARVSAELETKPEFRELFGAVKANYPDEYRRYIDRITDAARTGDRARVERESFAFTRGLMIAHFKGLAKAPSKDLHEIAGQYALLIHALQRSDLRLCAQFINTGFEPETRPAPEVISILGHAGAMQIAAARAGEMQPRDPRGPLSDSDSAHFYRALKARSASAAALLADQRARDAAPLEDQCGLGVAVYDTIAALPADVGAAVMITVLSESFEPAVAPGRPPT